MKFTQKQAIILLGGAVLVAVIIVVLLFGGRTNTSTQSLTLSVWGIDSPAAFKDIAAAYTAAGTGVTVKYTQFDAADYETKLLSALAAGTGPDVFEINNRELPKWESVIAPSPVTQTFDYTPANVASDFPTVVQSDFTAGGQVYGLPLDLDTLVMYYNKDLFDTAGIVYPPKTWDDLEGDVPKLKVVNGEGQITQAAVAMGGSAASIADAPDLIYLLMLQNGTMMTKPDNSSVIFAAQQNGEVAPGLTAFNFYLQFSNPLSPYYTWNDTLGDSLQSFIQGKTAIIFDYESALAQIKQKAPFLNVGVAPMLQAQGATLSVNYPSYEGLVASKQGQVAAAWQFITSVTTQSNNALIYMKDTNEPPANRALISQYLNDPTYGTFTSQALTARSWYEADSAQFDTIMNAAVLNVLGGADDSEQALGIAESGMNAVIQGH